MVGFDKISRVRQIIYSFIVFALLVLHVFTNLAMQTRIEGSYGVDWIIFVLFITYTMIPLSLRYTTGLGVAVSLTHVVLVAVTASVVNDKYSAGLIVREVRQ